MSFKKWNGKDIRVIVGIDFGTTFSGFSYCHIKSPDDVNTNNQWPSDDSHQFKTNTVLQYDENFEKVISWGKSALTKRQGRKKGNKETKPIELFKLNLGNLEEKLKPKLPLNYKKAIIDYLEEIGKLIDERIQSHWNDVDLLNNVLLVLTVPAEYSEKEKQIMRECAYKAKLISDQDTDCLQFTTEPEAAAIHCVNDRLKEYDSKEMVTFMIVDSGGGTVDLTTRRLIGKELGEITERSGDYCGSSFVDRAFLNYLRKTLGHSAIDKLEENNYKQLQRMVHIFCRNIKFPFTGDDKNFHYEFDFLTEASDLEKYVTGDAKKLMEENEWNIDIKYDDIKSMFDKVVERIIELIDIQLKNCNDNNNKCSIMFLVGGFSQSPYLQKRITEEFKDRVDDILVPTNPVIAIVRGAALYGLEFYKMVNDEDDEDIRLRLTDRVLKFTYGIKVFETWKKSDPIERRTRKGDIIKFRRIAKKGDVVKIDKENIIENLGPCNPLQTVATFHVYYTREHNAKYIDEPGMELLGKLRINLPDVHLGYNRSLKFGLSFGTMEIKASARNETNGQNYITSFEINTEE